jgi:3-oxoadipate enol-lactonase
MSRMSGTSRFVEVPGGRIWAVDEGSGPPIVLVHAAIVDLEAWDPVVPPLLRAGYRVIRYDMRGFGRTETEDVAFSPRADLIAVLDAFDVERAAAVGNSRGGQIVLESAIEYPERFVAVMTIGSAPGGFDGGATAQEEALFEAAERLEDAVPHDPDALAEKMVALWADGPGQPPTRLPAAVREFVRERARKEFLPGHVAGRIRPLEPPAAGRLGELRCPVLAFCGGLDISHEVKAAHFVAANAPNGRAVIWPDVAHLPALEAPDRFADLILEFLKPLASWR